MGQHPGLGDLLDRQIGHLEMGVRVVGGVAPGLYRDHGGVLFGYSAPTCTGRVDGQKLPAAPGATARSQNGSVRAIPVWSADPQVFSKPTTSTMSKAPEAARWKPAMQALVPGCRRWRRDTACRRRAPSPTHETGKGPPFERIHVGDDDGIGILRARCLHLRKPPRRLPSPAQVGRRRVEPWHASSDRCRSPPRASSCFDHRYRLSLARGTPGAVGPGALQPGRPATARTAHESAGPSCHRCRSAGSPPSGETVVLRPIRIASTNKGLLVREQAGGFGDHERHLRIIDTGCGIEKRLRARLSQAHSLRLPSPG